MESSEVESLSVSQLKSILKERGVDYSNCLEKSDLIKKVLSSSPPAGLVPPFRRTTKLGTLDCITIQNTHQTPQGIVILLHGYGANYVDLSSFGEHLLNSASLRSTALQFIFPNAPLAVPQTSGGRAWWPLDLQLLITRAMQGQLEQIIGEVPPGLVDARTAVLQLLEEIKATHPLPSSKIILGGFSQGAILSTDAALHLPNDPLGGLALFSGSMVNALEWKTLLTGRKPGTKILQSHGTQDMLLPFALARHLKQFLESSIPLDFVEFKGGHEIPQVALSKFEQFVATIIK